LPQFFKGDDIELKYYNAAVNAFIALSSARDDFFNGAFDAGPLGDILFTDMRGPLANAINQDVYRSSFNEIYNQFRYGGNFESYLDVFRKIFGPNVDVQFTVTAPGKLTIAIVANGFDLAQIELEGGTYDGDTLITQTGSYDIILKARKDIDAETAEVKFIIDDAYQYYDLVTQEGDILGFQTLKGFKSQYEVEQMLFELVPAGIFVTINLTLD
jgi:hypothetical protein